LPSRRGAAKRGPELETDPMEAIAIIFAFVIVLGLFNLVEFGRID
jgi:hypothetical protein